MDSEHEANGINKVKGESESRRKYTEQAVEMKSVDLSHSVLFRDRERFKDAEGCGCGSL
jgi:hypothetical protein